MSKYRIEDHSSDEQKARGNLDLKLVIEDPDIFDVLFFVADHPNGCECDHCAWLTSEFEPENKSTNELSSS